MSILAVVPARSGSKGFPHKNIAELGGKTLIELAVKVGIDSPKVTDVYISTDSAEYEAYAIGVGAKSLGLRPASLAGDTVKTIDVLLDLLKKLDREYDYLLLLQPTSPLRTPDDIARMVEGVEKKHADAAVSVCRFEEPHPCKLKSIQTNGYLSPFLEGMSSEVPRQMLPVAYALNGALYLVRLDVIRKQKTLLPERTLPYLMDSCINIDNEEDFLYLKMLYSQKKIQVYGL